MRKLLILLMFAPYSPATLAAIEESTGPKFKNMHPGRPLVVMAEHNYPSSSPLFVTSRDLKISPCASSLCPGYSLISITAELTDNLRLLDDGLSFSFNPSLGSAMISGTSASKYAGKRGVSLRITATNNHAVSSTYQIPMRFTD